MNEKFLRDKDAQDKFNQLVNSLKESRDKIKQLQYKSMQGKAELAEADLYELENIAARDPSTNLLNYKAFVKRLDYEVKRSKRYRRPVSLIVISIDNIDNVAKNNGINIVEDLYRELAYILEKQIRDIDVAARIRYDRLAVFLPETYGSRAKVVAQRIINKVNQKKLLESVPNQAFTASCGVTAFPSHSREADGLVAQGIVYLNIAQKNGGNQVMYE